MFVSALVILVFVLAVFVLLGRRAARRERAETPEQRDKRIRNRKDTAVVIDLTDHRRR